MRRTRRHHESLMRPLLTAVVQNRFACAYQSEAPPWKSQMLNLASKNDPILVTLGMTHDARYCLASRMFVDSASGSRSEEGCYILGELHPPCLFVDSLLPLPGES